MMRRWLILGALGLTGCVGPGLVTSRYDWQADGTLRATVGQGFGTANAWERRARVLAAGDERATARCVERHPGTRAERVATEWSGDMLLGSWRCVT